jgi:alkylhydroperoxidase family enzyme
MIEFETRQQEIVSKPPRIAPLRPDEIGEEAHAITKRIRAAAGTSPSNDIPEYVATMLRHPSLYEQHVALGTELLGNGALSARQRELAVLRTGWLCGAPYEWGEHVGIAKRAGLTSADIERVTQGSEAPGWNVEDRAVLRAAEELHSNAMIADQTWSELETFLNDRQLIELPYVIGNYTKVAFLQNALRLRLGRSNPGLSAR